MLRPQRFASTEYGDCLGRRDLDAVLRRVLELVGPSHVPVADGRDHAQLRRERADGDVEAHLVVALAGAAVRDRDRAFLARDVDEQLGDERTRERGGERIHALVQRAGGERRKAERVDEHPARVGDVRAQRAGAQRPRRDGVDVLRTRRGRR